MQVMDIDSHQLTTASLEGRKRARDNLVEDELSPPRSASEKRQAQSVSTSTLITVAVTVTSTETVTLAPTETVDSKHSETREMLLPSRITSLRSEAVFYPKFDNESRSDKKIRNDIMAKVTAEEGYLEVTLKHSGSLILWSGGQRYYSKNSTDNVFCYVAEILLRQHFVRAWSGDRGNDRIDHQNLEHHYQDCSKYLIENRLTLAFEVVTAVLGDHGDTPNRDFMILTAVADRNKERFLSTPEVIEFAQRFRLPHNDTWIVLDASGVKALFELYATAQEAGTARFMMAALSDKVCKVHVASMYPHDIFQGDILEGIIIRYVPYLDKDGNRRVRDKMNGLAKTANAYLKLVRPDCPPTFETFASLDAPAVLKIDVRHQFHTLGGGFADIAGSPKFVQSLKQALSSSDAADGRRVIEKAANSKHFFPKMIEGLTSSGASDTETARIADLIKTVNSLNKTVKYSIAKETTGSGEQSRWLCTIHVLHDQTFYNYEKERSPGSMQLFRGFCVEFGDADIVKEKDASAMTPPAAAAAAQNKAGDFNLDDNSETLMLKMKLLPYMVRTFICRNNLRLIEKQGPEAFQRAAKVLMGRWGISSPSQDKWMQFFKEWSFYAKEQLATKKRKELKGGLPPLSNGAYLKHLEHFTKLYDSGKSFAPESTEQFHGAVFVVCLEIDVARACAEKVCEAIGGGVEAVKCSQVAKQQLLTGVVSYLTVQDNTKAVKKLFGKVESYCTVIIIGCDKNSIFEAIKDAAERRKMLNMATFWRKYSHIDVPVGKYSDSMPIIINKINECSKKAPKPESSDIQDSAGLVVFIPGIPGCGKSAILKKDIISLLAANSPNLQTLHSPQILVGDDLGKNFWRTMRKAGTSASSRLLIADKNIPPSAWDNIGQQCAGSCSYPLPVLPDSNALRTQTFEGARNPDGSIQDGVPHYYPFSLYYLVVCISRVLRRGPASHPGKLDSGLSHACMVVVMFYSFYRGISSDELRGVLANKLDRAGTFEMMEPITLPFFRESVLPPLPAPLTTVLTDAINLQFGYDLNRTKPTEKDAAIKDMEQRLRKTIQDHRTFIDGLTVLEKTTRGSFLTQLTSKVKMLDAMSEHATPILSATKKAAALKVNDKSDQPIKLVSIDISKHLIYEILYDCHDTSATSFLDMACNGRPGAGKKNFFNHLNKVPGFIPNTHITMAHRSRTNPHEMKKQFLELLDASIEVKVSSLLWNERVAAFEVAVSRLSDDGKTVPVCQNEFSHLTIWTATGVPAFEANKLPSLLQASKATKVPLKKSRSVKGKLSFWGNNNIPLKIDT